LIPIIQLKCMLYMKLKLKLINVLKNNLSYRKIANSIKYRAH
jgi:hypothetical protein